MVAFTVHDAKTHLSRLLRRVAAGEEVVILRGKTPIARIVPIGGRRKRRLGEDRGAIVVSPDFDAELPVEMLADFEG